MIACRQAGVGEECQEQGGCEDQGHASVASEEDHLRKVCRVRAFPSVRDGSLREQIFTIRREIL